MRIEKVVLSAVLSFQAMALSCCKESQTSRTDLSSTYTAISYPSVSRPHFYGESDFVDDSEHQQTVSTSTTEKKHGDPLNCTFVDYVEYARSSKNFCECNTWGNKIKDVTQGLINTWEVGRAPRKLYYFSGNNPSTGWIPTAKVEWPCSSTCIGYSSVQIDGDSDYTIYRHIDSEWFIPYYNQSGEYTIRGYKTQFTYYFDWAKKMKDTNYLMEQLTISITVLYSEDHIDGWHYFSLYDAETVNAKVVYQGYELKHFKK